MMRRRSAHRWRDRRGRVLAASTIIALLALTGSAAATSDTTATRAYAQSVYGLDQAILHNATASRAAVATLAERIGNECHGVLAGAPREDEGPPGEDHATPRARGERERSAMQQQVIQDELFLTTYAAIYQPDRAAIEAYAGQVTPLSWSNPRIVPLVHFERATWRNSCRPRPWTCART